MSVSCCENVQILAGTNLRYLAGAPMMNNMLEMVVFVT